MSQTSLSHLASVAVLAAEREGDGKLRGESRPTLGESSLAGKQTHGQDTKNTPFGKCHPKASHGYESLEQVCVCAWRGRGRVPIKV